MVEIGHKELIQKPQYIAKCWQAIKNRLLTAIGSMGSLRGLYDKMKPSSKKVVEMLTADVSVPAQAEVFAYLKRFVKGMDDATLGKFLRFAQVLTFSLEKKSKSHLFTHQGLVDVQ